MVGVASDLRGHKLLAIGTVVLSFAIAFAWVETTLALYLWVSETWVNARVGDLRSSGLLFVFWHPFGAGLCLIWCVGSAASGRLIARWSGPAMLIAGASAQFPLALWSSSSVWLDPDRWAGAPAHIWFPVYAGAILVAVGMPGAALLGGLWHRDEVPVR